MSQEREAGFSLIEVALGLLLLGMLGGMLLPSLLNQQQLRKHQLTQQHQDRVMHSLALYVNLHGKLPCPGSASAKGKERGTALAYCTAQTAVGIVPYRTLGLPEKLAKDGYFRDFTYAVHPSLTKTLPKTHLANPSTDPRSFCVKLDSQEEALLDVQEGEAASVQRSLRGGDVIAFVLVSHGSSGKASMGEKAGLCKRKNGDGDLFFCAKPSPQETGLFDDLVKWETRYNFASYYMKAPCRSGQ